MTKEYLCKNTINEIICGEENPENFIKGRYGICKKCRSKMVSEQNQKRKYIDIIEKVKKIDPKEEIQMVIEYSIKNKNYGLQKSILSNIEKLNDENKIIIEKVNTLDKSKNILFENFDELDKNFQQSKIEFNLMNEKIYKIDEEFKEFKKTIDIVSMLNKIKDLENFKRDMLDENK
jgi:hypothetical protein